MNRGPGFRVYATLDQRTLLGDVPAHARRAEALGYDALAVPEAVHDGLLAAGAALAATQRLRVATSVLVAFPRSPMAVAHAAWDLQQSSGGRFELGLGTQVRGNIVGRYSTPWAPPVPRMREYVLALRAIFACWEEGTPLAFEGEHYRFTRMQPFFSPGPLGTAPIPIWLGAVGPGMLALAGEVADGLVTHPTHAAPRNLVEDIRPRLAAGAARAGRGAEQLGLVASPLVATGRDPDAAARARQEARQLLGFLFSTPAYTRTLTLFDWVDVGDRLRELARAGRWGDMPSAIPDDLLDTLVVTAPYASVADRLRDRYTGLATGLSFPVPADPACDAAAGAVIADLRDANQP